MLHSCFKFFSTYICIITLLQIFCIACFSWSSWLGYEILYIFHMEELGSHWLFSPNHRPKITNFGPELCIYFHLYVRGLFLWSNSLNLLAMVSKLQLHLQLQHMKSLQKHAKTWFNPQKLPVPFCGLWMTMDFFGQWRETIFRPLILEQLLRPIVLHIQLKNHHGRSSFFYKNEFCKKTVDHVVYFLKIPIFAKTIF